MKIWQMITNYALSDKKSPLKNRERVGQNLMLLAIFIFFVFMINFAIIIGTDQKFGVNLSEGAKAVYQTSRTIQARRGTIYDRNGIPIAEDSTTYSVFAIIDKDYYTFEVDDDGNRVKKPLYIQSNDYAQVADIFNRYLDMEKEYVVQQLAQEGLSQVSFGTKGNDISYSTMRAMSEEFEALGLSSGIDFTSSPSRLYTNGVFASDFIGLAQTVENDDYSKSLVGQTGLELALNDLLSGQDGLVTYQKDRLGNTQLGTAQVVQEAIDGQDVYTTLSAPNQIHLETLMDNFQEKTKGAYSTATLVHAKTGEILATSQRPSFNADTKDGLGGDSFVWQTLLYQSSYEPGSTLKVMTLAAAIDEGVFDPNETYFNRELQVLDATISDWDINMGQSEGRYLSMANALPYSSNIGMTMLEQKMGSEAWGNYLTKFRFGLPTRFGASGEEAGIFPANNEVTYAMSSFGQGISVTQVQMLRLFSAIANDGVMLQPQFISRIYNPNTGTERLASPEIVGNPVSARASQITRDYMVAVGTDPEYGTLYAKDYGPIIRVGNESVAVKSGTAQIAAPAEEGGGYLMGKQDNIYSVVAMVPAQDPEFIMYATVKQPTENWTGIVWEELFNPLLEEAMLMKDSFYTEPMTEETSDYLMPEVRGEEPGPLAEVLRRNLVQPIILGRGNKVTVSSYEPGENLVPNAQILLLTNDFDTLPDMYGWTEKNVRTFAEWMGYEITIKGKGRVAKQSLDVGTSLDELGKLVVTLNSE